jgi:manganese/zinc/iron transport system substrate-binding protein
LYNLDIPKLVFRPCRLFCRRLVFMRKYIGLLVIFVLAFLLVGCGEESADGNDDLSQRPIKVVATIGMITDIVKNIGGERVEVEGLMGPGVDPHLYKASEGDVGRLAEADLIFYNGLHLEAQMAGVLERMADQNIRTIAVTDGIDRTVLQAPPEFQGSYDPHVWFDVTLWMEAAEQVRGSRPNPR